VRILVGTSGYSYAPWKGVFYPEKLPAAQMLAYYAGRLPAVEINNTFYRMPNPELLSRWAAETPEGFVFVLKSPRRITHELRLAQAADPVARFATTASALGSKLGPVLFQLPPFLRKDVPRLSEFLAVLAAHAPGLKPAFEFRHASWFTDNVYAALRAAGAALCVADSEDLATPFEATAPWGYLRLRRQDYDNTAVQNWARRIRAEKSWSDAFVFFKHEDEGRGPKLAAQLTDALR